MPQYFYDHVHIVSPDPLKTAEFYEKAFNAKRVSVQERPDGRTSVDLNLNGSRVLIINTTPGDRREGDAPRKYYGLEHFGVRTDNLDEAVKNLKAMGIQFVQDITAPRPGARLSFLMAPDNVLIELFEIK